MEPRGYPGPIYTRTKVLYYAPYNGTCVYNEGLSREYLEGIGSLSPLWRVPGNGLELYGRLSFEGYHVPYAEYRGKGVKKPPGARGKRRVQPPFHHVYDDIDLFHVEPLEERRMRLIHLISEGGVKVGEGRPPGLFYGGVPSGEPLVHEVRLACEIPSCGEQELAAPESSVGPEASAFNGHPYHLPIEVMLGHGAHYVGVVVLHGDYLFTRVFDSGKILFGKPGREVVGMEVMGHVDGLDAEGVLEVLQRLPEEVELFEVYEVAYVLAHDGVSALCKGEGVL